MFAVAINPTATMPPQLAHGNVAVGRESVSLYVSYAGRSTPG